LADARTDRAAALGIIDDEPFIAKLFGCIRRNSGDEVSQFQDYVLQFRGNMLKNSFDFM
jgi:hypothetical protein